MKTPAIQRRSALKTTAALAALGTSGLVHRIEAAEASLHPGMKGRINHSVCKWCYPSVSLEALCSAGQKIGLRSIELLEPSDFPTLKKYELECAMGNGPRVQGPDGKQIGGIGRAFNRVENHDLLVEAYEARIKEVAKAGFKNVICFSGNRAGLDDEDGVKNCAKGLKRLMKTAERHGVTLVMELLNSRVNHKDYQCDHTEWGVALCDAIGSENFKLLYDIYHMQIMEGDLIATIKRRYEYIAHYHTGGVPGRHEIDDSQEIHYPAVMKAIVATGFKGHVAQEFIPARENKLASLNQGVRICDV